MFALFVPSICLRGLSRPHSSRTPTLSSRRRPIPQILPLRMQAAPTTTPAALQTLVTQFSSVSTPQLRYQQLLFFARELPAFPSDLKTDENRVRGCTSVVHVHVTLPEGRLYLQGDSDAQLTKGLLALLIKGLNGATPEEVQAVDASFIKDAGLDVSLTPSRNNGFVNMLQKIKTRVQELQAQPAGTDVAADNYEIDGDRPLYSAILRQLAMLKPTSVVVTDNSAQHAGHAGAKGLGKESHFHVEIVSDAFQGLTLVQRHRVVYALLQQQLDAGVHALQIDAKTPQETT